MLKYTFLLFRLFYILLILHGGTGANAQHYTNTLQAQWKLNHLTVDDGLSNNFVHSISRDRFGYIWIATSYGLNRFNGIEIKKYYHSPRDSFSLSSNFISRLFVDSEKTLWVGTDKALHRYDDKMERFITFDIPDANETREVFDITEDLEGNVLIGTSSGLFAYNINQQATSQVDLKSSGMRGDSIYRLSVDPENNLWIARHKQGLYHVDRNKNKSKRFTYDPNDPTSLSENWIATLFRDTNNNLWAGTQNSGISKLNPEDSTFSRYDVNPGAVYTKRVRCIFQDLQGRLFFGTREGLYLFNQKTEQFSLYALNTHEVSQLSQNSVTYGLVDNRGNVWLGTHSGGVSYFNMHQKAFVHYPAIEGNTQFLSIGSAHCFAKTQQRLYVGTDKGINILDLKSNRFTYLKNIPDDPTTLSYNDVKSIAIESKDKIWVATNRGGLELMNGQDQVVRHFRADPSNQRTLPSDNLYGVLVDSDNNLWVLSNDDWDRHSSVLNRLDRETGTFHHYNHDFFLSIYQPEHGKLMVGGSYGFFIYDRRSDSFQEYKNDSLIYRVNALFQDRNRNIWLGCNSGLIRFDHKLKKFESMSAKLGLPTMEVYGILEDKNDLWISSNDGLIKLENIYEESETVFNVYNQHDGLQSREFNYNAFYKDDQGGFYFGGDNGFNVFYPEKIKKNPYPPQVWISSLRIADHDISPGQDVNGYVLLNQSIRHTQKISLAYGTGTFTLGFDVLHYANANANRYKYRLKGMDKEWTLANSYNNYVTYHELNPGPYQFELFGINADGVESESPALLNIYIMPPFWQTWWFRAMVIVIIASSVFLFVKVRTRNLQQQKARLSKIVEERTRELLKERKHLEETMDKLVESEKLASLGVFTAGIAHEINNPTNYISGAMVSVFDIVQSRKEVYDDEDIETLQRMEETLKFGIKRITGIVESLKNYTRLDNDTFTLHNVVESIEDAIRITENKTGGRISINKHYPEEVLIECLPTRISQIMINLIDNAADAIEEFGSIDITVTETRTDVAIAVKDTGTGISQEDIKYIFDPFFTTKEVGKGTGLGLYVSHGYVVRHGGTLTVKSDTSGTEFLITLPVKQEV